MSILSESRKGKKIEDLLVKREWDFKGKEKRYRYFSKENHSIVYNVHKNEIKDITTSNKLINEKIDNYNTSNNNIKSSIFIHKRKEALLKIIQEKDVLCINASLNNRTHSNTTLGF